MSNADAPHDNVLSEPRAPLWVTFVLTWVNNIGASAALMGVYFIAREAYRFTARESLCLGILQGVTYVAGAMTAGPLGRFLSAKGRLGSTRTLLATVLLLMGAIAWLPVVWRSPWAMWVVMAVYSPLSGWLWPLIETFLASGRTGADLRRTTGSFNFAWSSCQFVTFWAMAPFMPEVIKGAVATPEQLGRVLWIIPLLSLSHVLSLPLVLGLPREPGTHHEADAALSPEQRAHYKRLLTASRCLIVMGYVSYSAMAPLLPTRLDDFAISPMWKTPVTSTWMICRVAMFGLMAVWHGWQGRRITLAWSGALLFSGFALVLLAPDRIWLGIGLALFGLGHGSIYSAAFYYAMEVGSAGVDAGGKHEALIGCGYTVGPIAALMASFSLNAAEDSHGGNEPLVVTLVGVLAVVAAVAAYRAVRRGRSG